MKIYTILLSTSDRNTVVNQLQNRGFSHYAKLFVNAIPVILDSDSDDHSPRGYGLQLLLSNDLYEFLASYVSGLSSLQVINYPWQVYVDNLGLNIPEEHSLDCFLATRTPPLRRPGHFLPAYATAEASGLEPAQDTTTSRALINQWTALIRCVNMDTVGSSKFQTRSAGLYDCGIKLRYEPVENTRFGLQLCLWRDGSPQLVGPELTTSDGIAEPDEANFPRGELQVADQIGLLVRSDSPASFKITRGYFRLRRIG